MVKKLVTPFPYLVLVLGLLIGFLLGLFAVSNKGKVKYAPVPQPTDEPVACTLEAQLCPDGSYVGRTGTMCEFAPCPVLQK